MLNNPVIETMMNRASIRIYTDQVPADEVVETIVRAGQQAPFAYQMGSLLLSRDRAHNPFGAPLFFIVCVDSHRHEAIMAKRGWQMVQNDLSLLLFGIQDATLMAEAWSSPRRVWASVAASWAASPITPTVSSSNTSSRDGSFRSWG